VAFFRGERQTQFGIYAEILDGFAKITAIRRASSLPSVSAAFGINPD
jgi:hypothetical protein